MSGVLSFSLRPLELTDADDAMAWGTDYVLRFFLQDPFTSRDDAVAFIRDFAIPNPWCRAICVAGRPVGFIFVKMGEGSDSCRPEIGYALAQQYWGLGIATSAVRMMVNESFRELPGLERIEGMVDSENFASLRVLEKCGFVREGVLRKYKLMKGRVRDIVIFSILSQDVMQE